MSGHTFVKITVDGTHLWAERTQDDAREWVIGRQSREVAQRAKYVPADALKEAMAIFAPEQRKREAAEIKAGIPADDVNTPSPALSRWLGDVGVIFELRAKSGPLMTVDFAKDPPAVIFI